MAMAQLVSTRATCARRQVGCVLVDDRGRVLATGYNGPPSGFQHCTDEPCAGAKMASGIGLDVCEAVHAEMNAVAQCTDASRVAACYVTCAPCVSCAKLLVNTACRRVVFAEEYPGGVAERIWRAAGREWVHKPLR
jgi:dCMP deaminase